MVTMEKPKLAEAQRLLGRALDADPEYGLAHAVLANTHFLQLMQGWSGQSDRLARRHRRKRAQGDRNR